MAKRLIFSLSFAVLLWTSPAFACRSDEIGGTTDVTTYKNDLNADLHDYGAIFEESAPWSGCTQAAADALYKKLYTHFHASWPVADPSVCPPNVPCADKFQGWLQGGAVALIHATALRLANVGKLSKPLDALIQRIPYDGKIDLYCGFDNGKWVNQNSCMDDYSLAALGWAWVAAYKNLRGISNGWTEATNARNSIRSALSTDTSTCAWSGAGSQPDNGRGPCTGNAVDLRYFGYSAMSLHSGDSIAYGLGLLTSIGGASVGLSKTAWPLALDSDEQLVVQKLYEDGLGHTDGTNFSTNCYRFAKEGNNAVAYPDYRCEDQVGHPYRPKMFPVSDFINNYAPPAQGPGSPYSEFDDTLFCDTVAGTNSFGGDCGFYNSGRRAVYQQMGHLWVQSAPNFFNTSLSDYTATFRTVNGNYLSARGGGGSDVNAEPTFAGATEQFSVYIRNGDTQLMNGDTITLMSMGVDDSSGGKNAQYIAAEGGGGSGSVLNATRLYPHSWETFTIHKLNGTGAINSGDSVALQSINGFYASAINGGGSNVLVDETWTLSWETFTITLTHN